jgi:hypothetical protein
MIHGICCSQAEFSLFTKQIFYCSKSREFFLKTNERLNAIWYIEFMNVRVREYRPLNSRISALFDKYVRIRPIYHKGPEFANSRVFTNWDPF